MLGCIAITSFGKCPLGPESAELVRIFGRENSEPMAGCARIAERNAMGE